MISKMQLHMLAIIILIFAVSTVHAQEGIEAVGIEAVGTEEGAGLGLTAEEMVDYHIDLTRGESSHGVMEMDVVTPDWSRTIEMEWWEEGEDLMLIRILNPARDEGDGTLKIENNLWSYVWDYDQLIHVPPAMMMQAWMGSDFTNDDLVRESSLIDDYDQILEGVEEVDGETCYSILITTDPSTPVLWLTMRIYLRVEDLLPVRQEYFDDDDVLARYMVFSDFQEMDDRVIPATMRMIPLNKEGEYTEMRYTEVEFDIEIPDDMFTLETLQNY